VATPPTLVSSSASTSGWGSSTSPQSASALSGVSGDYLVVLAATESNATTLNTPTGGGFVYTLQKSIVVASNCAIYLWTAPVTSTGSVTVQLTHTASVGDWGFLAALWRGSDGIGASNSINTTGAPSLSLTTTQDNSAVMVVNGDFNAGSGARTWRTINGITPSAGNGAELAYAFTSGRYTAYVAQWSDAGTAGAVTTGLSAPTGQAYAVAAVEVKGAAAAVRRTCGPPSWSR
jgi:hypothetical protein